MADFAASGPKPNLRYVGFCGADDSISPEMLQIMSLHYSWIEWGFLFRPDLEGTPRYPTEKWVDQLVKVNRDTGGLMHLAGHLCGARCQEVIDGNFSFVKELASKGFGRVQVNATSANNVVIDKTRIADYAAQLRHCIESVPEVEWIIQCNDESQCIWEQLIPHPPANMSILFDSSCGLGTLIQSFPEPFSSPDIKCGYAGGIGPSTLVTVLEGVARAAKGKAVWIDMESSLRVKVTDKIASNVDVFNINKCFECILIATQQFGLPVSRFTLLSI